MYLWDISELYNVLPEDSGNRQANTNAVNKDYPNKELYKAKNM